MEELRLVGAEPHMDGEDAAGDDDEAAVAGVVLALVVGDFFGVVGVIASCRC